MADMRRLRSPVCLLATILLLTFGVAPLAAQAPEGCPADAGSAVGLVGDTDAGVPLPGAIVEASWTTAGGTEAKSSAAAGALGDYMLCGLPLDVQITLRARFGGFAGRAETIRLEAVQTVQLDLKVSFGQAAVRLEDEDRPGRVLGTVLDRESGETIEAADVMVSGGRATVSDATGHFVFQDISPGEHSVTVRHLGYKPVEESVTVPPNRTVEIRVELAAEPIELEPIVVTTVRDPRLEVQGFYERKRWSDRTGLGYFVTADEIKQRNPQRITHVFSMIPGVRVRCAGGMGSCFVEMARTSPSAGCTQPNVYLDGVKVLRDNQRTRESVDMLVLPHEVAGIEVYRGPSEVPAEYQGADARCGAVVIWTHGG
jgi:hypothetical protein